MTASLFSTDALRKGFTIAPMSTRVAFGAGAFDNIAAEVHALNARRVMIIASVHRAALIERAQTLLGNVVVAVDHRAVMHVPEVVADSVYAAAMYYGADLLLPLGGGSAIGMAKAVAKAGGPPFLAVPTTYSGSEMTSIWGVTREGNKHTGRDNRVRARAVTYDPMLLQSLPARIAVPSAFNALAHCLEALYAPDANPLVTLSALEGVRALVLSIPQMSQHDSTSATCAEALYGACLGGFALGMSTMGLHHKLAHVLGGAFGLPHAETHAILLPHTIAYNVTAAHAAMDLVASAVGEASGASVPQFLHALAASCLTAAGSPTSLGELGMTDVRIQHAASLAIADSYPNPAPLEGERIALLLARATAGVPPGDT